MQWKFVLKMYNWHYRQCCKILCIHKLHLKKKVPCRYLLGWYLIRKLILYTTWCQSAIVFIYPWAHSTLFRTCCQCKCLSFQKQNCLDIPKTSEVSLTWRMAWLKFCQVSNHPIVDWVDSNKFLQALQLARALIHMKILSVILSDISPSCSARLKALLIMHLSMSQVYTYMELFTQATSEIFSAWGKMASRCSICT